MDEQKKMSAAVNELRAKLIDLKRSHLDESNWRERGSEEAFLFIMGSVEHSFTPKVAIPLSTIPILGSSLTNLLLNVRKRHPLADRPLIDWI